MQRNLSELEVRQINFIIKSRANRYVGAANKDWLYPEQYVSKSDWNTYGDGYLLMPDPRSVHYGGETFIGWKDGTSTAFDAYGRRPWEPEFSLNSGPVAQGRYDPLERFQSEFARRYGPYRRGRASFAGDLEQEKDGDNYH